jgi:hypothetical protein
MIVDPQPIEAAILRDESVKQALGNGELSVNCELVPVQRYDSVIVD